MNGATALGEGLEGIASALRDLDEADAQAAQLIAAAAPPFTDRITGYLASATRAAGNTVTNPAPYAAFEDARHPFLEPAADSVDWAAPHEAQIAAAVDNLKGNY